MCIRDRLSAWGVYRQYRETTLGGGVIAVLTLCAIIATAFGRLDVNLWIAFAVAGVILVFASSALERYGKRAIALTTRGWAQVKGWS